jgi:Fe-S cluster biogenesis protein NfuA
MTEAREPALPGRLRQLENQLQELDAGVRAQVDAMIRTLLDFHGAGLARLLGLIAGAGEPGQALLETAGRDDLVANLLLLHGLHPVDMETRVGRALEQVRPFLQSQGAGVALVALADDAIRLRLQAPGAGFPVSLQTVRAAIAEAVAVHAPEVETIDFVEGECQPRRSLPLVAHPSSEQKLA